MEDGLGPASDENTLTIPDSWRRRMYPRRGGPPGPVVTIDRYAGAAVRERVGRMEASRPLAERDGVGPDMAEAMREYLSGGTDPLGAAVVAALLIQDARQHEIEKISVQAADSWVTGHGLPFAACAFAEFSQILWHCPGLELVDEHRRGNPGGHSVASTKVATAGARLRALLATADDQEYQEAVDRLAGCRRTASQRVVVSFLVPTRHDWVEECCAAPPDADYQRGFWWMLYGSLGSPGQVDRLARYGLVHQYSWDRALLATMADGVGAAMAPLLVKAFDADPWHTAGRRLFLEMLAILPGDEAFQALMDRVDQKYVQPALLAAMKRFPTRARRLLAVSGEPKLADLLAQHLQAHPELAADRPATDHDLLPDAPADALPRPLVDPPWLRTTKAAKPAVVGGLTAPAEPRMRWEPGEQELWAKTDWRHRVPASDDWDELVEEFRAGRAYGYGFGVLTYGPVEKVRPLLADWKPQLWEAEMWLRPVVARFEVDALPVALRIAEADPGLADRALPFLDAGLARLMAERLARPKTRKLALAWFDRHGLDTVPLLVPAAVGKPVTPRRQAERALRLLADRHGSEKVVDAARAHGGEAAGAIEAMLAVDPLELLPSRIPVPGEWADVNLLPRIRLRDREDALPLDAIRHLLTMLAMSTSDEVYSGVEIVKDVCDADSLAAFGWALFQQWQRHGAPPKDGWALAQLGWLGDDETVRALTPLIRAWPGDGGHAKAVAGLNVLAAIGTDAALMNLYGLAQKVKFKGLKERAQEKIEEVADGRGLTPDQLGDRLVPDFGLDADGGLVLDYGRRRFVVGFDERLKPYVTGEDGTRRSSPPKPGAKDDEELAPAAYTLFTTLKKDVRVAADQIRRLEAAMVARRRWTAGEFRRLFVEHPLIWHIARRLVWVAGETAFRVTEERTYADIDDDALTLPDQAGIGIPHPLELGGTLSAWSALFADHEILQPFPQLGRTVHALADAERAGRRLERFQGVAVPAEAVLGLERRGWRRSSPMDAGIQGCVYRELPGGLFITIKLNPGIVIGRLDDSGDQLLEEIRLDDRPDDDHWSTGREGRPFGDLDPITASELLTELTDATS
ncbi:DUF4132 domain-containing protein [Actinoallomurus purpureus]|uniref:DUF4132 domain-containing protein n=1 Tax=Actinoallomurus purpureus TaxID=478114 RepID=UPI0020932459|nr:DUF4132 domain-containing protein [Actinoallomurus purpureus]MCO6004901.1 DUF4132 domain-containing protein [Actinoallomurus purpureus]